MTERPTVARSELEVARVVWRLGRATVRDVQDAMPNDRDLDFKTVQTYLRRLEAKGYLASDKDGRSRVYRARVRPRTVIRDLVRDFVERLFDGDAVPLVQTLVQEQGMTEEDLQKLRDLLDEAEGE